MRKIELTQEYLLDKIDRVTESGCWIWLGPITDSGYGYFGARENRKLAHRAAFEIWNGQIPEELHVCHRCDVTLCINPKHLFLGTDKDNVHDSMRKGRFHKACGEKQALAKLTEIQVREILEGGSTSQFAKKFGVSTSAIKLVKRRRTWKHIC